MNWQVEELRVGRPIAFGPNGEPSAIDKHPVADAVRLTAHGLDGDAQGDTRHHGGAEKAVHLYPSDHYAVWRSASPEAIERLRPGAFGENLVVAGLTEADVCIGDLFSLGEATVQLSQGRQPCWKLNVRFGVRDMARRVQQSGRTGWYFRVIDPGDVRPGDWLSLTSRPNESWPLSRVNAIIYSKTLDRALLQELADLPGLSASWRRLARRRLARQDVEDWDARLRGPARSRTYPRFPHP